MNPTQPDVQELSKEQSLAETAGIWDFDYTSISGITELLKENGLYMTKKFGQNFLISDSALDKIRDFAQCREGLNVWEVGPGLGALTSKMLKSGARVTAFEIDRGFCKILKEKAFANCSTFTLVEGDALKNWHRVYEEEGTPDVICANLPYNVGSVFIADLIENRCLPPLMVYTLQTEVVKRICAKKGDEDYSGFSVLTSIDYENKEVLKLSNRCFWPVPNVGSSVVRMVKRETSQVDEEISKAFIKTTRLLFSQRRKTVKNNLKNAAETKQIEEALKAADIKENERAENLDVSQIAALTKALYCQRP
ncbi:MAG: 16S rRNA (adenine(1518)-N(6)/adenine(1519)-N(6))-dimethyltransferase RsmA [Sphaerochaetaceae bacterium]|nr:16S rRNA (adenine(1518)-N(6)/adenine(1519)-N(6))-dimethyltransferase RsmA [Sphaerochaetaceae bacterium]